MSSTNPYSTLFVPSFGDNNNNNNTNNTNNDNDNNNNNNNEGKKTIPYVIPDTIAVHPSQKDELETVLTKDEIREIRQRRRPRLNRPPVLQHRFEDAGNEDEGMGDGGSNQANSANPEGSVGVIVDNLPAIRATFDQMMEEVGPDLIFEVTYRQRPDLRKAEPVDAEGIPAKRPSARARQEAQQIGAAVREASNRDGARKLIGQSGGNWGGKGRNRGSNRSRGRGGHIQ